MDIKEYQEKAHETAVYPGFDKLVIDRLLRHGIIKNLEFATIGLKTRDEVTEIFSNPYYPALGLAGEVGEFCNKLKKVMRDDNGAITPIFREDAQKELGDILWYLAEVATALGMDLESIAEENIAKLHSRRERGMLKGSGDNR